MTFSCYSCKQDKDFISEFSVLVLRWGEEIKRFCKSCRRGRGGVPDVYFKGPGVEHNIASEEFPGAKYISTRAEKKMWLEKCNLREAGDRVHGATSFDKISNRHAMESLRRKTNERR